MKKTIALLLTLGMISASLAGCASDSEKLPEISTDRDGLTPTVTTGGDIDPTAPESTALDFSYRSDKESGGVMITKYNGTDTEVVIPETIDGKKVTKIGYAFYKNETVVSVKMPDTVTSIEFEAFLNCTALTTVEMSSSLEVIKTNAFMGCTSLENITLPDSLTAIGEMAFYECYALKNIRLPKSLTISNYAFWNSGLETVEFEDGLTSLGYGSLGKTNLKEVVIPGSVKTLESGVFSSCEKLEKVTLNEGLETLENGVFYGTKIKELTIPKSVKNITENSAGCGVLEKLIFEGDAPENFYVSDWMTNTDIHYTIYFQPEAKGFTAPLWYGYRSRMIGAESGIKENSEYIYVENEENGITIVEYIGSDTDVVIPETIDGKKVTVIGNLAFADSYDLVSVKIPDTVTVINQYAFNACYELTTVVFPKNLKEIRKYAFWSDQKLTDVTLPDSLTTLGDDAFSNCRGIQSVRIPKSVTDWGNGAFAFTGIETVELEDGLEMIGEAAFYDTKLKEVVLPASIKTVSEKAFYQCARLESVTLNEGLETIGKNAFTYTPLKELVLPSTVKTIEYGAFDSCRVLEKLTLNNGLVTIGDTAFNRLSSMKEIVIPATVTDMTDRAFYDEDDKDDNRTLEAVKFEGNAPVNYLGSDHTFLSRYITYYHEGAEGFDTPEWKLCDTAIW